MHSALGTLLALAFGFSVATVSKAQEPTISYDYMSGAYAAPDGVQPNEIAVATRWEIGDWTLRARTRLHLAPLDPYSTNEPYRADLMFGGRARIISDDTRVVVERPIVQEGSVRLTFKGQLRLPTAENAYYRNASILEGALGLEAMDYRDNWMFWVTGMQRFREESDGLYRRKDSWDADLGVAHWIDRYRMVGMTASHWTSSYEGGRTGDSVAMFLSERFTGTRKGELRAYFTRQISPDCCFTRAAVMLHLELE